MFCENSYFHRGFYKLVFFAERDFGSVGLMSGFLFCCIAFSSGVNLDRD